MYDRELEVAIYAGKKAQETILEIYKNGFIVEIKDDNSPVTIADKSSDEIIKTILGNNFPMHKFLTEESEDDLSRINAEFVWVTDPLDGTKNFVNKDGDFAINIALVHFHEVVLGVVFIPLKNEIYYAIKNEGAFHVKNGKTKKIYVSNKTQDLTCLISSFHFNDLEKAMIEKHKDKINEVISVGASLKPCLIAEGKAELSYRFSPNTKEWDTAAPQLIVEEAGGIFIEPSGKKITYNRLDVYNRNGYIIANTDKNILK